MRASNYCKSCGLLRTPIITIISGNNPRMVKKLICPSCQEHLIKRKRMKSNQQQMNKSAFDEWLARIIKSYGKNKLEWPKHVRESYRNTILLEVVEIDGKGKGEHPPSNTGVKIIENQQLPLLVLAERLE